MNNSHICSPFSAPGHERIWLNLSSWELVTYWWPGCSVNLRKKIQTVSVEQPRGHAITLHSSLRTETKGKIRRQTSPQNQLPHVAREKADSGQNDLAPPSKKKLPQVCLTCMSLSCCQILVTDRDADPAHFNNVAHKVGIIVQLTGVTGALLGAVGRSLNKSILTYFFYLYRLPGWYSLRISE